MTWLLLLVGGFCKTNSGEVAGGEDQYAFVGAVEFGGIDGARHVGHEHSAAGDVEGDADSFHQMREHDLWRNGFAALWIEPRAIDSVAERRIAAVGPVEDAILQIEFQIDWLREVVEDQIDVVARSGR